MVYSIYIQTNKERDKMFTPEEIENMTDEEVADLAEDMAIEAHLENVRGL
tara:strand:- start:451 stop:600 length:150 start_codon:yes stop_codon:yes gene_type:complete